MKFEGKWMKIENIIRSEVTQTQKDKHDKFTGIYNISTTEDFCSVINYVLNMNYEDFLPEKGSGKDDMETSSNPMSSNQSPGEDIFWRV
ncbi:hypothetical protein STEG23_003410 [Scotinomys teguina]